MSEIPSPKNKIHGRCIPCIPLMKKKPCTIQRRYSTISSNHRRCVTMTFSVKVANYILKQNLKSEAKNVIISPLSMDIILNIIALGSKGATLKQLLDLTGFQDVKEFNTSVSILSDVLRQSEGDDEGPEICFANAIWIDQMFLLNKQFEQIVRDLHNAEVMSVDFTNKFEEAAKKANLWVQKQSKGLIKEILSPDASSSSTIMLLANALYFKGTWVKKFDPEETKYQDFYLLNGEKVQVPFMKNGGRDFDHGIFKGCEVLRMSYKADEVSEIEKARRFSMYIVLPKEKDGLSNFLGKVEINSTMFLDSITLVSKRIGYLAIPKFKFDYEGSLKMTMMELGLTLPFDRKADITNMVDSEGRLYVDEMFQKSYVEVDESGTKATTLTLASVELGASFPPPPSISFVADHPFMFLIREDYSGAILFMGTVLNP